MIQVEGPDGAIHEFDDAASPEVIKGVMARHYGSPATPAPAPAQTRAPAQPTSALQAADDIVRALANGVTGGYADKFAAKMNELTGVSSGGVSNLVTGGDGGSVYERNLAAERAKSSAAMERAGGAGTAAQIIGSLLPASRIAKAYQAVRALPQAPLAISMATGAGVGTLDAAGNDRNLAEGAAFGAGAGLLGHGAAKGASKLLGKAAGAFNRPVEPPSARELKATSQAAYKAAEDAGVIYNKDGVNRLVGSIQSAMADFGYDPAIMPKASGVVANINRLEGQNATLKGIETLRKVANNLRMSNERAERKLGGVIVDKIDDFVATPNPSEVMTGNATDASRIMSLARDLYKRSAKASDIETAVQKAQLRASSTGTGGNVENATRQELRKLLERGRGWTPDERAALQAEVSGTPGRNVLRSVGGLSPDKGVIPLMANIGAVSADPMMLGLSAGAMGARRLSESAQRQAIERLSELVRAGGSKQSLKPPPNAVQKLAKKVESPLARALTLLQLQRQFSPAN